MTNVKLIADTAADAAIDAWRVADAADDAVAEAVCLAADARHAARIADTQRAIYADAAATNVREYWRQAATFAAEAVDSKAEAVDSKAVAAAEAAEAAEAANTQRAIYAASCI